MNLSCSSKMIKYLMFGFNLFFVLSGIIIIAVGATVRTVYTEYADFLSNQYFSLPNMLIATGALIFVVSFFGCCGAVKESWIMLGIFSICLCIIFIFQFASGIAGYVLRSQTADYLDRTLRENIPKYNTTHDIWDLIQSTFECCGVDSYDDWENQFTDPYALPMSCCPAVSGTSGTFHCNRFNGSASTISTETTLSSTETTVSSTETTVSSTEASSSSIVTTVSSTETTETTESTTTNAILPEALAGGRKKRDVVGDPNGDVVTTTTTAATPNPSTSSPFPTGCKSAFGDYIKKHAVQIGGCALGLAIVQLLGIVFSCHLVRQLKNGYYST